MSIRMIDGHDDAVKKGKQQDKQEERKMKTKKYCIVRSDRAGVFAGYIKERNGREVTIENVRRLWYWNGAASLSQLAAEGVKKPKDCKFTMEIPEITVLDVIEFIPCSAEAEANIKAVPEWKM